MKWPFRKKISPVRLLLYSIPVIAGAFILIISYKEDLVVYPGRGEVAWATDKTYREGKTETHLFHSDNQYIKFSFTLRFDKDGSLNPFAIIIFFPRPGRYFDLSGYDYVDLEVDASVTGNQPIVIPVSLQVDLPNMSVPFKYDTYGVWVQDIVYQKQVSKYRLKMDAFQIPYWWWEQHPQAKTEDLSKPDFSKVTEIHIAGSNYNAVDLREDLAVHKVTFKKDLISVSIAILFFTVAYYAVLYSITRHRPKVSVLPHNPIPLGNLLDEETRKLIHYIAEHYKNPELASETLQKALGMSEGKIAGLLKSSLDTTFKKYLNQVRLQEACRLLIETDRPVNEIAYHVGYANITHFNRVFKEVMECSPNQYRKNAQLSGNPVK